ncbi:IS3 family transposase [Paenirhodobacter sp.]|uniref:IS3 family transposase n=1 Tax=Paenirhodobacter sp. TaxID=1965326 RepID=UPI003B3EEF29
MIERDHPVLSVRAQSRLLSISRSSFYYTPKGETEVNLDLMLLIDKQFLETPFYGVQQRTRHLENEGHAVNVKRIRRLMRPMRLMPIDQMPNNSKPAKGHKTCWVGCGSIGPTRSRAPTSPACRCAAPFGFGLEPCMDGSRVARGFVIFSNWSGAVLYSASRLRFSRAP